MIGALTLLIAGASFAADRWEFWFPDSQGSEPSPPSPSSTTGVSTNSQATRESDGLVAWNDTDCLVTSERALRESLFIATHATFERVDCALPHTLFVSTYTGCNNDAAFRAIRTPSFKNRLVEIEYQVDNPTWTKCLIGVSEGGQLQEVTWLLDDLSSDLRWAALQVGACVPWDSANIIESARTPSKCAPGLALVFETEVEGAQSNADLNAITDSVCGTLANDVGSTQWRSQWLNINASGRTPYWCAALL